MRLGVAAAAVALVLLSIPGGLVSDVAFASMAGATDLLHGTLPYGHLPQSELVHGDTYPLLAYLAYVPAAVLGPCATPSTAASTARSTWPPDSRCWRRSRSRGRREGASRSPCSPFRR